MAEHAAEDNISIKRKKLSFRCWHRGTREMDLLLGRFADAHVATMTEAELDALEEFLNHSDPDIYNWVSGFEAPPADDDTPLLRQMIEYYKNYSFK
jgi:antitoxin CptB